ncbi:MAG: LacI family DNA-binding transcriptional regulator [Mycobacterium sp.]
MKRGRPTLHDVAERAGTSTAVVSYVINNGPRPVASETRSRVEAAISELGYRRSGAARSLRRGHTTMIGMLVPDATNSYFASLAAAVERAAFEQGYATLVAHMAYSQDLQRRYLEEFLSLNVAAVVFVGFGEEASLHDLVREVDGPVLLVHRRSNDLRLPSFVFDDREAGRLAAEHLISHGRQRLLCVGVDEPPGPIMDRCESFAATAELLGTACDTVNWDYDRAQVCASFSEMVAAGLRFDGVFASTDEQATGILAAASQAGLIVGRDISVIGTNGTRESATTVPALTTVHCDVDTLAAQAVAHALAGGPPQQEPLPVTLLRRASCGCSLSESDHEGA